MNRSSWSPSWDDTLRTFVFFPTQKHIYSSIATRDVEEKEPSGEPESAYMIMVRTGLGPSWARFQEGEGVSGRIPQALGGRHGETT